MSESDFFTFACKRHGIYLARENGAERPWTDDPVLHKFRFTNVYRELDATTVWFRENVREPLRTKPEVLLATVLFRWFNRMTTGDAIFCQRRGYETNGRVVTAWRLFLDSVLDGTPDVSPLREAAQVYCGDGPYVTGAYIIKTPDGYNKLDGVLQCVEWFCEQQNTCRMTDPKARTPYDVHVNQRLMSEKMLEYRGGVSLEDTWEWLRKFPYLGDFMAYEIVTDLRHTALLDKAPDIMTWANPGPGAMRGLNRVHGRDKNFKQKKHLFVCEMRDLLDKSKEAWPARFPSLEMRDIEHTLCEFDKYERARLGEGRPRGVYR